MDREIERLTVVKRQDTATLQVSDTGGRLRTLLSTDRLRA
jgi:hypothetical protein